MSKNFKRIIGILLTLVMASSVLTACTKKLKYTGSTLASGKVGEAYSQSVTLKDGPEGISYAVKDGSVLPAGLTLSAAGTISGTPTAAVLDNIFTITASAEGYKDADAEFTVSIEKGTILYNNLVGTTTLTGGKVGTAYSASVATATGSAAVKYALKGADILPSGLTLSAAGAISGTPSAAVSNHTFTVVASAAEYSDAEAVFSLSISSPSLAMPGAALANGKVDVPYSATIQASGTSGAITYAFKGNLPAELAWLNINSAGQLSGTPTLAGGPFSFAVVASAAGYLSAEAQFSIIVQPIIHYSGRTLTSGKIGTVYNGSVATAMATVAGAQPQITYAITSGSLPAGLTFDNGVIGGTPTAVSSSPVSFTVTASSSGYDSVAAAFTISVAAEDPIVYSGGTLTSGRIGTPYTGTVATAAGTGSPVITYALKAGSSMPLGLVFNNGAISGTPSAIGNFSFWVVASAAGHSNGEAQFSIAIANLGDINYTGTALLGGTQGAPYSSPTIYTATAVGNPTITYALETGYTLPAGLSIGANGTITGTPTVSGSFTFIMVASAANYTSDTATFSIEIAPPALIQYKFEGEHVDFTGKRGRIYSSDADEEKMIVIDGTKRKQNASNGYSIGHMYVPWEFFEFVINSDVAVDNVVLTARLSAQYRDIYIAPTNRMVGSQAYWSFTFAINEDPEEIEAAILDNETLPGMLDYAPIAMTGATPCLTYPMRPFDNHLININVSLRAGENKIIVMVTNTHGLEAGIDAMAPMIDCLFLATTATLTWTPKISNETKAEDLE